MTVFDYLPMTALASMPDQAPPQPEVPATAHEEVTKSARRVASGDVFGRWTVGTDAGGSHAMAYRWNCRCSCGTERSVLEYSLLYGASLSCGCLNTEKVFEARMKTARARFVGKTFGWLTVSDVMPAEGSRRGFQFLATCACGATDPKRGVVSDLAAGKVSSCCGPAPYTEASQRLLLDVLAQLRAGATQYAHDHRIVKVLSERGAFDIEAWAVTAAGEESLASGSLRGYMDDVHSRRERRSQKDKLKLVRRTFQPGQTVAKVAREAQIAESLLSRWRKKLRDDVKPKRAAAEVA